MLPQVNADDAYSIACNESLIKISTINVGGLQSKLKFPDFTEYINEYDLICITETHLDIFDNYNINNYSVYNKVRNNCKRKSGGISLIFKSSLKNLITIKETNSEFVLWFTLKGVATESDILFGCVYLPPEGSPYAHSTMFDELENDIINVNINDLPLCLLGDFNSRTALLPDFYEFDHELVKTIDKNNMMYHQLLNIVNLSDLGIPIDRFSVDKKFNSHGKKLLEICKNFDLHFSNGRLGKDCEIGKQTNVRDKSVIDYVLLSPTLIPKVYDFEILDFNSVLSDIHCAIKIVLKRETTYSKLHEDLLITNHIHDSVEHCRITKSIWKSDKKDNFKEAVASKMEVIQEINQQIGEFDYTNITKEQINDIVTKISNIMLDSATSCKLVKKVGTKNNNVQNFKKNKDKKWFNQDCKLARENYLKAKFNYRCDKCVENKQNLKKASKLYKSTIIRNHNKYIRQQQDKIRSLNLNDSRSFWQLINNTDNRSRECNKTNVECSLNKFVKHFENLSFNSNHGSIGDSTTCFKLPTVENEFINHKFSENEISLAIRKLKVNKCAGNDNILNEYIKYCMNSLLSVITKCFNLILDSGIFPDAWTTGYILPIYKNKGSNKDPDNYRGITILSCFGKLFTSVINNRLSNYLENFGLLDEEQAGFRSNYGTSDHIFALKLLVDIYLNKKKNLYVAFVDFRKAFDNLWRVGLWQKLLNHNINGKIFRVIVNLYDNVKSSVKLNGELSELFLCNVGVRQGENLSPLLFSIFLNDMCEYMSHSFNGLNYIHDLVLENLETEDTVLYFTLYLLLYSDDTIILAETSHELQAAINALSHYCKLWKLEVNETKTKIVVFSKKLHVEKNNFTFNGKCLETVQDFRYLGIDINKKGSFIIAKDHLYKQGEKAMYSVLRKSRSLHLPIDLQIKLFDSLVLPILLYGSEIWGYENHENFEKLQRKFCK